MHFLSLLSTKQFLFFLSLHVLPFLLYQCTDTLLWHHLKSNNDFYWHQICHLFFNAKIHICNYQYLLFQTLLIILSCNLSQPGFCHYHHTEPSPKQGLQWPLLGYFHWASPNSHPCWPISDFEMDDLLLILFFLPCHLNSDPFHLSPACCFLSPWAEYLGESQHFFFFTVISLVIFRLQILYQSHVYVFKLSDWLLVWTINVLSRCPFNISIQMSNGHHKINISQSKFDILVVLPHLELSLILLFLLCSTSKSNSKFCLFYHQNI